MSANTALLITQVITLTVLAIAFGIDFYYLRKNQQEKQAHAANHAEINNRLRKLEREW